MNASDLTISDVYTQYTLISSPAGTGMVSLCSTNPLRIAIYAWSVDGTQTYIVPGGPAAQNFNVSGLAGQSAHNMSYTLWEDGPIVQLDFLGKSQAGANINVCEVLLTQQLPPTQKTLWTPDTMIRNGVSTSEAYNRLSRLLSKLRREWHDIR